MEGIAVVTVTWKMEKNATVEKKRSVGVSVYMHCGFFF